MSVLIILLQIYKNFLETSNYFGEALHLQICHFAIRNEVHIFASVSMKFGNLNFNIKDDTKEGKEVLPTK